MDKILTPQTLMIMDRLAAAGYEARVAGGAVRDAIKGIDPKDIDLATTARPEVVQDVFEQAGFNVIPTGLQHGTVTVVVDGEPFEITTLRIDQNTDGRHAEVEFTDDWKLDAERRDFTMNAMFVDRDGNIHDFFNGEKDLRNHRVRFVGDPVKRIQEDYLRILRFFRFKGRMTQKTGWISREEREAIEANAKGLRQISGERIWVELQKIMTGPVVSPIIDKMNKTGVTRNIDLGWLDTRKLTFNRRMNATPVTMLVMSAPVDVVDVLVNRYKVSADGRKLAEFLERRKEFRSADLFDFQRIAVESGKFFARELAVISGTPQVVLDLDAWAVPEFPVRGQDLLDLGMKPGPDVGARLQDLKREWINSRFLWNRESLLATTEETDG